MWLAALGTRSRVYVHSTRSSRKKESNAEKEPGRLGVACERTTRVRSGRPLRGRVRHVLKEAVVVDMTVLVHLRLAEAVINLCTQIRIVS